MSTFNTSKLAYFCSFESDISTYSIPSKFTYPFCYQAHPLALAASQELQKKLEVLHPVSANQQGRMYGVLVVKDAQGKLGYLCALSGNASEANDFDVKSEENTLNATTFVPAIYQAYQQSEFEISKQIEINGINEQIQKLEESPELEKLTALLATQKANAALAIQSLQQEMRDNKSARKEKRAWLESQLALSALSEEDHKAQSIALSRASVTDKKALQALKLHYQDTIETTNIELSKLTDEIASLKKRRKQLSTRLQKYFFKQYQILNIKGECKDLIELFAETIEKKPPAGSGDCAAPKLLQYAFQQQLIPLCMAEFWWGQQPSSAIRKHKHFYPACQSKCLPILTHMLDGMNVDENPLLVNPAEHIDLEIVFQDEHVVVVNKPAGLLSVPGKSIKDSVFTRIKALFPWATGGLIIHRLDMATSGLLMLSLNERAHKHLQQQFINKEISKRYVAVIDGELDVAKLDNATLDTKDLTKQSGYIRLPLRGDFDDRPKQMVCHEFGKYAETYWQIISRADKTTTLFLYPITGRTHQLRMHCAHPDGLNIPIVGDSLYGTVANRLHLHAQRLSFTHPITKEKLTFEVDADF